MNSNVRSIQILIDLLKQNGISDVVLSPGGSDIPLIHSIETDTWFNCYSVVDERSAAYFAMGIAQEKNKATACICTSGTAVCNYLAGITEAYYQNVPILAITADKNPYFQGQLETQKIDQSGIFNGVIKKSVDLPIINTEEDEWLCNRLVNEAILALYHHGTGPVHINLPIVGRTDLYNDKILPRERIISIINYEKDNEVWKQYSKIIEDTKRILIVIGQNVRFNENDIKVLNKFHQKTNCVYSIEHLSNLSCEGCVSTYPVSEINDRSSLEKLVPDLVISIGNNLAAYNLKPFLRRHFKTVVNWLINQSGDVRDAYKCLTTIFECEYIDFFKRMCGLLPDNNLIDQSYENLWKNEAAKIKISGFDFSNMYVASKVASVIPENSILHLAILNSTRIMQYFRLKDNIRTYSNVGALGIDGCLSTFAGQAAATSELAFLIIGDLSFFYDMNAAGLRNINNNVRIILVNNGGGSEFHFFIGKEKISTINEYICAEHGNVAAGWIMSLGYDYYSASTKEEFDEIIDKFNQKNDRPMFLEAITDMEDDARITKEFYNNNRNEIPSSLAKNIARSFINASQIEKIKKILKIIKNDGAR